MGLHLLNPAPLCQQRQPTQLALASHWQERGSWCKPHHAEPLAPTLASSGRAGWLCNTASLPCHSSPDSHECAHTHLLVSAATRMLHAPPFPKPPVSQEGTFITSCLVSSDTPDPIFARASLQPLFLLSPTSTFQMTSPGLHRPRSMLSTPNAPVLPLKF
jgi:hypothetical protein